MTHVVTEEMKAAGFAKIKELADEHGEGWALRMVSSSDVMEAMMEIYVVMREIEPAAPPVNP
jgi:hypothetical protein